MELMLFFSTQSYTRSKQKRYGIFDAFVRYAKRLVWILDVLRKKKVNMLEMAVPLHSSLVL
jgi:hypothetical protein